MSIVEICKKENQKGNGKSKEEIMDDESEKFVNEGFVPDVEDEEVLKSNNVEKSNLEKKEDLRPSKSKESISNKSDMMVNGSQKGRRTRSQRD